MMYHVFSFGGALFYLNSCICINKKILFLGQLKFISILIVSYYKLAVIIYIHRR